jgi:MinD superfamily P-loop ATPase
VIINRDGIGDSAVEDYCKQNGLPILMRIPLDRRIADGLARGIPLVKILPEYLNHFNQLYQQIRNLISSPQVEMLDSFKSEL